MFIHWRQINHNAADVIDVDTWEYGFIYSNEWTHQWTDYVTRTTGRFTSAARCIDLEGVSLVKHYSRAATKRDGKIMNEMQNCYPQMLENYYLCNSPDWMHLIWVLVKPILPQRVLEKTKMISPQNHKQLHKYMDEHMIPVEIGGPNQTPPMYW
ncbi:expressed unknown protein [Seminavis robusta]|uniref:CRAL-TRIO domain-containing protein n=1 Tax=Seminavis robusta TaxID=568900 RepID=A0A9N8ESK9_9STRA|nr:expressed unknown protein [Seminavis robusta]|eukprot:Sro1984_g309320.1 n/a (154) ;mRNA; f:6660-7207